MTDPPDGTQTALDSTADAAKILELISARHASLEQRGISVVTTTGTLVTLLLALSGLAGGQSNFTTRSADLSMLPWALTFLVLAVIAGLGVNYPLTPPFKKSWPANLQQASGHLREVNHYKSWILIAALVLQTTGVCILAFVAWAILSAPPPK